MQSNLRKQKLVLFGIAMLLIFSYPLISIPNTNKMLGKIPVLYCYVFIAWMLAIFLLYRLAEKDQNRKDE